MTSHEIRAAFLSFFKSKGHQIVSSAPMVVKNDPTLMFTNAGMNQFKDLFLGNAPVKYKRIANTQKCLRVSGKHNDLEEVGIDTYHHTMFEMLGNWSFGDYFKKEAIAWSWELLTDIYKIDKSRLYVTVFEGDAKEKLAFDQDSYDYWKALIDEDRILRGNKKDNFWEMGDSGPCGPCTEIHVDLRSESERSKTDGKALVTPGILRSSRSGTTSSWSSTARRTDPWSRCRPVMWIPVWVSSGYAWHCRVRLPTTIRMSSSRSSSISPPAAV
jgi:alanyl-tRNA synthetase